MSYNGGEQMVAYHVMQDLIGSALRTEPSAEAYRASLARLKDPRTLRLLHAAMGLCTEAGEFVDQLKKHIFYGKPLDTVNLIEELGDSSWYERIALDALETSYLDMLQRNVSKLKARFPDKFTEEKAQVRDLVKERVILENEAETIPSQKTSRHYFTHSVENPRLTTACTVCGFIERHPIHDMTV